jgi:protein-S-isoprenylcysteine O-methyltransferase Ste14
MIRLIVFAVCSACLIYVSRVSLLVPRSHGFYRFLAMEFILVLVLVNVDRWFHEPFSAHQIVSWVFLAASIVLVTHGFYLLHVVGRPDNTREEEVPLLGIEKTTSLVTVGAYKYIRHPIYGSAFYGTVGVFFKDPSWIGIILALAAITLLVMTAKVEEAECTRYFGPPYRAYVKRTKMFVPFLF